MISARMTYLVQMGQYCERGLIMLLIAVFSSQTYTDKKNCNLFLFFVLADVYCKYVNCNVQCAVSASAMH